MENGKKQWEKLKQYQEYCDTFNFTPGYVSKAWIIYQQKRQIPSGTKMLLIPCVYKTCYIYLSGEQQNFFWTAKNYLYMYKMKAPAFFALRIPKISHWYDKMHIV